MGVSKVEIGENTLIDLTQDTVAPSVLQKGYTAHGADGEPIEGTQETVIMWQNTENGTYKFEQNGDRWIANNRGINTSTATSTWSVSVPEETTAYIGYRTATESADKLSITLNGEAVLSKGGNMASETVLTLNLVAGENILTATYAKDGSVHSYGDMAYVVLPPIGEKPGLYMYQSKSVTPSSSTQTVYPDVGYDGLYAVTVGAASLSDITICDNLGSTTSMTTIPEGYKAYIFLWITSGLVSTTLVRYGNDDSPGFLYYTGGREGSGNAKACYTLNIYDGSIGGIAKIRSGFLCFGLK